MVYINQFPVCDHKIHKFTFTKILKLSTSIQIRLLAAHHMVEKWLKIVYFMLSLQRGVHPEMQSGLYKPIFSLRQQNT